MDEYKRKPMPTAAKMAEDEARKIAAAIGFTLTIEPVPSKKPGLHRIVASGRGKDLASMTWGPVLHWLRKQQALARLEAEARARAVARGAPKSAA